MSGCNLACPKRAPGASFLAGKVRRAGRSNDCLNNFQIHRLVFFLGFVSLVTLTFFCSFLDTIFRDNMNHYKESNDGTAW